MTTAVRVGLVGAGRMGSVHLRALDRAAGVSLAAIVDPMDANRGAASTYGCAGYRNAHELLEARCVEAVVIAAPSDRHLELIEAFAAAGIPMLCEKPVGVRATEAIHAVSTVANAGVLLQVGYWRRFVPALVRLRTRIEEGELGTLRHIVCNQWDGVPPAEEFRNRGGGISVDMAVHEFDQARWLTGQEIVTIHAMGMEGSGDPRHPDAAVMLANMADGTMATISVGWPFPHGDCAWVEVVGTAGYERLPFMWGEEGANVFLHAVTAQAEAFALAVRGHPEAGASGAEAVAAIEVAESAADSLVDGTAKQLPAGSPREAHVP